MNWENVRNKNRSYNMIAFDEYSRILHVRGTYSNKSDAIKAARQYYKREHFGKVGYIQIKDMLYDKIVWEKGRMR